MSFLSARAWRWVLLGLAPLLAACMGPTPYQPATEGQGYAEREIETDRYRVTFAGNSMTPLETVENYLLYRAAELTRDTGNDYFIVVDRHVQDHTSYRGYVSGFDHFRHHGFSHFGSGFDYAYADTDPITSYTAMVVIRVFKGEKPVNDVNAYDARDVLTRLSPLIVRPETGGGGSPEGGNEGTPFSG